MKGSLFVVGLASLLVSACGGSQPAPETAKTETRSAAVAPMPAAGPRDQASLRASLSAKADAAAKAFAWTEKPTLDVAPQGSAFGAIGDSAFAVNDVEIQVSEASGTWSFRARGGESGILGPNITFAGAPVAGQAYNEGLGNHVGTYFQAPRAGRAVGTKDFAETIELTGESAYSVELTKLSLAADGKTGTASGRFVYVQKDAGADFPAMRAAGTFENATVRVWKK